MKQPSTAEKFAAIWEKKNAKAARAGGVSLMALSLAACGGSSSTSSSTTTTTTTTPSAQTYVLTTNVDDITGGAGDDTVKATLGTGGNWSVVDIIDGGAGDGDTLAVVDTASGGTDFSAYLLNVSNIEKLSVRGSDDINVVSKGTAFTSVTTSQSVDATVDANAASAVDVSGATGDIVIDGGSSVTVGDATAAKNITIGGTTAAKSAITVTDTNVTSGLISVNGGTDVIVTASKVSIAGSNNFDYANGGTANVKAAVIVGNTSHDGASTVTGNATVTTSGAAITTASSDATLGAISAGAKGNVTITQSATSDASAAAADTASVATITQGAVFVSTGADGTTVSVTQDANQTANDAVAAVAAKDASTTITFKAMTSGQYISLTGAANQVLKFTAAKNLTATEVAEAFANLSKDALVGSASAAEGKYENGSSGSLAAGYYSGGVTVVDSTSASVTFSTATLGGGSGQAITVASSSSNASAATAVAGNAATLAETGKLGVVAGAVHIDGVITGTDVLKDVTIDAYETASTLKTDALETLTLKNSDEDLTVTTAGTGTVTVNVDKVAGATATLSLDGTAATVTGLNVNATGTKSDIAITADAATTVAVNAAVDLDLTSSSFGKATKITVEGAGKVTLDGDAGTSVLASVDASAATGTVDASGVALTAAGVYKGGSGADTFTVTASATGASTAGAGDDVVTVSSFGSGGSVDAGAGNDTLVMTAAQAATADASTAFTTTNATNFEVLELSGSNLAATTLNMENLGLNSVTTAGTGVVTVTDGATIVVADKLKLTVNGTAVTTGALHANTLNDTNITAALNTAINSALSTNGVTYVAAAKSSSSGGNTDDTITVTAANDGVTLTSISHVDVGSSNAETAGTNTGIVIDKIASGGTVKLTKDGDVTVQVKSAATGTADVLNVSMETDGALDAGELTAANIETINISSVDKVTDVTGAKDAFGVNIADGKDDTNATHILNLSADKATTVNLTGSSDITLDLVSSSAVTTFNASTYTGKIALTLDGAATGTTFTGGSGVDTIAASGDNDVINGGDGADVITVATLTTVTGGAGADVIKLTGAVAATKYSTITDASAGDVIDTTATSFTSTAVSLAATASFQDYLDASVAAQTTNSSVAANWFQHGGNTYLVIDGDESNTNSATYVGTNDGVIALTGLIDLSIAAFNATTGEFTIA